LGLAGPFGFIVEDAADAGDEEHGVWRYARRVGGVCPAPEIMFTRGDGRLSTHALRNQLPRRARKKARADFASRVLRGKLAASLARLGRIAHDSPIRIRTA
jgi:hypothetical protein